jgi:hypothetical protein
MQLFKKGTLTGRQSPAEQPIPDLVYSILRAAVFLLFAGRAWQHLFWDAPFRALLWDQGIMEGIVLALRGGTWQEYVTSESADRFIRMLTLGFGIFYSGMAILTLVVSKRMKKLSWLYILSSVFLAFLAFLYCKEKFYHLGQFLEYAIQFLLPVLFIWSLKGRITLSTLNTALKVAIALTFSAHGLYAVGFYPQPGVFVDMVIQIFNMSEQHVKLFLKIAGVLDFVLSILVFVPRASKYALLYAAAWGGLTALARTWAFFDANFALQSLHQDLYETIYRLPHMLVPLAALYLSYPGFGKYSLRKN